MVPGDLCGELGREEEGGGVDDNKLLAKFLFKTLLSYYNPAKM